MKKTALVMVCLFTISAAYSQISKGQKMIGGELTFRSTTEENTFFTGKYKTTTATVTPQIGFGLGGNWIAGGGVGFAYQSSKSGTGNNYTKQTANIYSAGLFVRHFHPFNDKMGIFGQLDAGAGFGKSEEKMVSGPNTITTERDVTNISAMLKPGFYFKATRRIILEAGFGGFSYTSTTNKPENGEKTTFSAFDFALLSTLNFGFQVIL